MKIINKNFNDNLDLMYYPVKNFNDNLDIKYLLFTSYIVISLYINKESIIILESV